MAILKNTTTSNGTESVKLPTGSTSQRPSNPAQGMFRYNTDIDNFEGYNGTDWVTLRLFQPIQATGGTVNDVIINGRLFREHVFSGNSNYDFTVTSLGSTSGEIEYELQLDGYDPEGGGYGTDDLGGVTVRKLSSFSPDTCFKYLSTQTASSLGYTDQGGATVGTDDALRAKSEVGGSCRTNVDFFEGFDLHMNNGGRMPTLEEYLNNVTQGSGCGHDNDPCWTVTAGSNESERWVVPGRDSFDGHGGKNLRSLDYSSGYLRDVAEVDLNRPDPVILQDNTILTRLIKLGIQPEIVNKPKVQVKTYNLLLGSGVSSAIPNTGPAEPDTKSGVDNRGTVIVRYPLQDIKL